MMYDIYNIVRIQFPFHPEAMFPYGIDFRRALSLSLSKQPA